MENSNVSSNKEIDFGQIQPKKLKEESLPNQLNLIINFKEGIFNIKELSNNRIGILFEQSLLIYSSHTFKQIYCIKPFEDLKNYKDKSSISEKNSDVNEYLNSDRWNELINFVELKNKDLIIWSHKSFFYYRLSKNINKLYYIHQIISLLNEKTDNKFVSLYSVNELMNGSLVSCSNLGLKFYNKINDNFIFISENPIESVKNIFEFAENQLILFQEKIINFGWCGNAAREYLFLSLYDIKKK